jgi:hypothetical protein
VFTAVDAEDGAGRFAGWVGTVGKTSGLLMTL